MHPKNEIEKGFKLLELLNDKKRKKFQFLKSFFGKKEKEKKFTQTRTQKVGPLFSWKEKDPQ